MGGRVACLGRVNTESETHSSDPVLLSMEDFVVSAHLIFRNARTLAELLLSSPSL